MHHRGACQCTQPNQQMCANTTVDFRVTATVERCVANLPSEYECNQQRNVCQYGERQKNSFHGKVPVTDGRPAGSEGSRPIQGIKQE